MSIVVLFSGGLDSTLLLWELAKSTKTANNDKVYPLFVDYGQHSAEQKAAECLWNDLVYDREPHLRSVHSLAVIRCLHLCGLRIRDPKRKDNSHGDIELIPARNTVLAMLGYNYAVGHGATQVMIGINKDDREAFPDCTPAWVCGVKDMFALNNKVLSQDKHIHFRTPYLNIERSQLAFMADAMGVPTHLCMSCYYPQDDDTACGKCHSCLKGESHG